MENSRIDNNCTNLLEGQLNCNTNEHINKGNEVKVSIDLSRQKRMNQRIIEYSIILLDKNFYNKKVY